MIMPSSTQNLSICSNQCFHLCLPIPHEQANVLSQPIPNEKKKQENQKQNKTNKLQQQLQKTKKKKKKKTKETNNDSNSKKSQGINCGARTCDSAL